ncbi:MAG TPA: chemotaxis protein CheB, partial [Terriglobales bacterium]
MPNRDLVVIGASAGGIGALRQLCAALPSELNAAVLVVLHTAASSSNLLPRVLHRIGCLNAITPDDGETLKKGTIYVAPADRHMVVEANHLRLVRGPRENHNRPAIDPTFRSAALAYGPRVIGVVLTGSLDDGTNGLMVIRAHRGEAIVQNPTSVLFPAMPENALRMNPCFVDGDFDATHGTSARVVARVLTRRASRISGIRRDTEKFPRGNSPDIFCGAFSALFGYALGRLRSRALTENRSPKGEFQPPVKSIRGGNPKADTHSVRDPADQANSKRFCWHEWLEKSILYTQVLFQFLCLKGRHNLRKLGPGAYWRSPFRG